jgi:hypothetical protein
MEVNPDDTATELDEIDVKCVDSNSIDSDDGIHSTEQEFTILSDDEDVLSKFYNYNTSNKSCHD